MARPPGTSLDDGSEVPAGEEVSPVDSRGRVSLPDWMVAAVSWTAKPTKKAPFDALAVCSTRGLIRLLSWESHSASILARRAELVAQGDLEAVTLLEHRYRRLTVPKELRPTIGLAGIAHLGLPSGGGVPVYIVLAGDAISIVSQEYRDRQLEDAEAANLFANLP